MFKRLVAGILLTGCIVIGTAEVCTATGSMEVVFDQPGDCAFTTGWELAWEPTAGAAEDKPSPTAFGVSIPNDGTEFECGIARRFFREATGVGQNRFWMRANSAAGFSAYSNFVDANIPFAHPVLRSVEPVL